MTKTINWGILSTARIANKLADAVNKTEDCTLLAVGSRSQNSADEFADRYGIPRRYASYEQLVADPDIDVIYVATPHPFHMDNAVLALEAGKAVLVEKPFTMNAPEAQRVIETARARGLFLMEAMWTRFLPIMARTRELIRSGAIGDPRLVQVDFGFFSPFDPKDRLFAPELGGGALLDVGIYTMAFVSMVLGTPQRIESFARIGQTGVDEENLSIFTFPNGAMASMYSATQLSTLHEAIISGTEGILRVNRGFHSGDTLTLMPRDASARGIELKDAQVITEPTDPNGFIYQVQEVNACLRAGKLESDIMPLDETLAIMQTLDQIMARWQKSS